jgi:hypothetical protein
MMATFMSQRPEDKRKEKTVRFEDDGNAKKRGTAKTAVQGFKIGPPAKRRDQTVPEGTSEPDEDNVRRSERVREHLRGKGMPYVDVPPLKETWRSPASDPIKENQDKLVPAYKSRAPVEIGVDIEKLVETVLDLEINVPLRSLAGVSTAIQKEIKKQVTKARLPIEPAVQANLQKEPLRQFIQVKDLPVSSYMTMEEVSEEIPEGFLVAGDPVIQYLLENKDADPGDLIVANDSEPLKAIFMNVNQTGQEECVLDYGSEIVSMARPVAVKMGLTWDPYLSCSMGGSTNHHVKTLGIARNVRMTAGGVSGHFQMHILENPPYKILLGRPFDVLMKGVLRTRTDGSAELEITDPNTKKVAVIPTYDRDKGPEMLQRQTFQSF